MQLIVDMPYTYRDLHVGLGHLAQRCPWMPGLNHDSGSDSDAVKRLPVWVKLDGGHDGDSAGRKPSLVALHGGQGNVGHPE